MTGNTTNPIQCPACKGTSLRRSHRANLAERFYSLFGRYPYRCQSCQSRFLLAVNGNSAAQPSERRLERVRSESRRKHRLILLFIVSLAVFLFFAWKFILPPPAQQSDSAGLAFPTTSSAIIIK